MDLYCLIAVDRAKVSIFVVAAETTVTIGHCSHTRISYDSLTRFLRDNSRREISISRDR